MSGPNSSARMLSVCCSWTARLEDMTTIFDAPATFGTMRRACEIAEQFQNRIASDDEAETPAGISCLQDFVASLLRVSEHASAGEPHLFADEDGYIGVQWSREVGNCYLYARLDKGFGDWKVRENGTVKSEKRLDLRDGEEGWENLAANLSVAV